MRLPDWIPIPSQILDDLNTIALRVDIAGHDHIVTDVHGPVEQLLGVGHDAILGPLEAWMSRTHPAPPSPTVSILTPNIDFPTTFECRCQAGGGKTVDGRNTVRRLDDEYLTMLVTFPGGHIARSGVAEASSELESVQKRYRAVFEASLDPLLLLDPEGQIVEVSHGIEKILGWSPSQVLERHFTDFVGDHEMSYAVDVWERARGGESLRAQLDVLHEDRMRVPVEVSATSVDLDGAPHVVAVLRDLRETIEMKTALAKIEQRLARTEKLELVGELAGGIAHDLHNILAVMTGSARMIVRDASNPTLRGDAEAIVTAGNTAAGLSRRLLALGDQSTQTKRVHLETAIDSLEPLFKRVLPDGVHLSVDVAPDLPPVDMDSGAFEQLLLNLLINARDAITEGGGTIELIATATNMPSHGIRLEVRDDGRGMPPEVTRHIFEPLYTTKGSAGTGLGLATVARIVDKVGGSREVESELGEGTRFVFHLPAADDRVDSLESQPTEATHVDREVDVLVVDDTEDARRYLVRALESQGCRVVAAESAADAMERIAELSNLDVIVTDLHMPNGSGVAPMERARSVVPDVPVVFVTADQFFEAPDEASGLLHKPFSPSELLETILVSLDE